MDRSSLAIDSGTNIPVAALADGRTLVLGAADADRAVKFFLLNNSDTDMTLHLKNENFAQGQGIVLKAGGYWEEDQYADVVYAAHHGVAGTTKNLTRVIF